MQEHDKLRFCGRVHAVVRCGAVLSCPVILGDDFDLPDDIPVELFQLLGRYPVP